MFIVLPIYYGGTAKTFLTRERFYKYCETPESVGTNKFEVLTADKFKRLVKMAKAACIKNPIQWAFNRLDRADYKAAF